MEDNFRHYGLSRPELLCADQSVGMWARAEVFDGIVSDPPYGVRAGARRSGRKGEVREVRADGVHIPPSQQYDVEDVIDDLLDMAARTLKLHCRLVYLLPTVTESVHQIHPPLFSACISAVMSHLRSFPPALVCSFTDDELPRHPCLRLVCVSEQVVRHGFSRRLITMEKHRTWSPALNLTRRDKSLLPPPKYANLKSALLQPYSSPADTPEEKEKEAVDQPPQSSDATNPSGQRPPSKRQQRRQERYDLKREHKAHIKQHGLDTFPPDAVLLFNATVYSSASSLSTPYTWLVLSQGKIHSLGRNIPPLYGFPDGARAHNLRGRVVLPGLIDSHCHVYFTGKLMTTADFRASNSIPHFQSTLRDYIASHPPPATSTLSASSSSPSASAPHWVVGNQWDHTLLGRYPRAADVDAVVSDRPVFCWRVCYHVAVVNTAALRLAGITRSSVNPPGGSIDRDEAGEPTGLLRETAAEMVVRLIGESMETKKAYVKAGLQYFLEMGITYVQTNDEGCWPVYCQLADEGQLPIRVALTIMHKEMGGEGQPQPGATHGPLLSCHRIKLFADGALGAETAALSQPYVHRCAHPPSAHAGEDEAKSGENLGILIHTQEGLTAAVRRANDSGYRIEMHVIGDRAASLAVQAFIDAGVPPTARPILTHCQVLSSALLTSFRELNVVANIQPQFLTTDARWLNDRLPPSLLTYAYAWRSLLTASVHCAGGSDSPIEIPSPWEGMHAAVFRPMRQYREMRADREGWERVRREQGGEAALMEWCGGCWKEEERLNVEQALELYTKGGAYCGGVEGELGELREGLGADFVVVDCDIIKDPHALIFAKAEEVWVAGVRRK